jgi:hypothetical protein
MPPCFPVPDPHRRLEAASWRRCMLHHGEGPPSTLVDADDFCLMKRSYSRWLTLSASLGLLAPSR